MRIDVDDLSRHPEFVEKFHGGGKVVGVRVALGRAPPAAERQLDRPARENKAPKALRSTPPLAGKQTGSRPEEVHMTDHPLQTWHRLVRTQDAAGLATLLAEDAVFHSPVVHTPQRGRGLAILYLGAAFRVFFNPTFRYVREIVGPSDAMLEFETEIDGVHVNGIDLIKWNERGEIVDFKVMLRPLKAIHLIHQKMGEMLQSMKG